MTQQVKKGIEKSISENSLEYTPNEQLLFKKFRFRCLHCGKRGIVLHELEPRSRRPKDWDAEENRVLLCAECHNWAHKVSCKASTPILREQRERFLHGRSY